VSFGELRHSLTPKVAADECYPAVTWMEEAQAILKAAEIKNKSK
jgi:hypothetical protein